MNGAVEGNLGKEGTMHIRGALLLLCMIQVARSQKWKQETPHWYPKGGVNIERKDGKACSNLTQILDNWKFAILTRMKELLINDHASVLPEYSRIAPLSDALGELHRQFNALKNDLASLSTKLDGVEAFVEGIKDGSFTQRARPGAGLRLAQMRSFPPSRVRRRRGPH
uniref:Si:dkey-282h22.5 n=1 Tax=Hippocampus comes TaxID=109280 RepID=A0A3Q2Y029_HIPCM